MVVQNFLVGAWLPGYLLSLSASCVQSYLIAMLHAADCQIANAFGLPVHKLLDCE